jgi:hypothetical protein
MTNTSISRYLLGIVALLIIIGGPTIAAIALRRRFLPTFTGALGTLATAVASLAFLLWMSEVLGTLGLFKIAPLTIVAAAIGLAGIRVGGGARGDHARAARMSAARPSSGPATTAIAIAATAAVTAEWAIPTIESYTTGIRTFDSLWYHLPWAASFAQTGHITPLRFTDIEYLTAFYPAGAELLHGLGIVALARDTVSPGLNLLWLGLVLLAAYCIGRARGVGWVTLLGAALAMATPMMMFSQAGSAANDVVGVFFLLAAVALLIAADGNRAAFVLAAVAAGLAAGTKLSLLAPVLALTIGAIWVSPATGRRAGAGLWIGGALLAGGFWYLRNLIAVGNPAPWVNVPVLTRPTPPLQQHTAFSVAHYLTSSHIVSTTFVHGLADGLGSWWPAILAAAVLGPLLCLDRRASRTVRMLGLVVLASLIAYLVTPESAAGPAGDPLGFAFNLRYSAPALTLSLALLPLAPLLAGPRRSLLTAGALAILLVATLAQARLWPSHHLDGALVIGVLAGAIALVAAAGRGWITGATGRRAFARPLRVALIAAVLALVIVVPAGYALQRSYLRGRYVYHPGISHLAPVWALFRTVHNARVGIVGTFGGFFSYPLYGVDDSNRVQYLGQRGPHGSFTAITSCAAWRSAVNAGHFDYVVTTPSRDPWHPSALGPSPEGRWTSSDPAATTVYRAIALGQPISVYRLHGRLDPTACR